MKKILVFLIALMSIQLVNAQTGLEGISTTVEMYFEGWLTGDTTKLGKAMHTTCHLKFIKDGELVMFNREEYLSKFKPRPRLEDAGGKMVSVNITGNVAGVKCVLDTPKRMFTDYFNMMKIGDRWYIVDKISTSVYK